MTKDLVLKLCENNIPKAGFAVSSTYMARNQPNRSGKKLSDLYVPGLHRKA
jgi:hypothetical protein